MGENSTVDVSCFGTAKESGESDSNSAGTTSVAVADYFETPATYLVDEDTTIRRSTTSRTSLA